MNAASALKALLHDRRRAQRGSVLSGVLIMVAFLAIISGALMTELSTHFLISRVLVNRVGNEATVNSAMELALDQLQHTALASGCPGQTSAVPLPAPLTLNNRTAAVSYGSCWPTIRTGEPRYMSVATSASFNVDGTQSLVYGQNLYLVGDSTGMVYQYKFGQSSPVWSLPVQSTITGPPLAMIDAGNSPLDPADISNLVPIAGGGSSGCTAIACVKLLQQDTNLPGPDVFCFMGANAQVTSRPAAGLAFPALAYFGDNSGTLWAYTATEAGHCALQASSVTVGNAAIVAGPIVFNNVGQGQDEIYVGTVSGSTSQLVRFTYQPRSTPHLTRADTLSLPFSNLVGIAPDQSSVPARVAATFADGTVAMVNIPTNFDPVPATSAGVGSGFAGAPAWCSCPSGPQIGVAGINGTFYILNPNLTVLASYDVGPSIHTAPAPDGVGEWFFGADDGYLYELQEPAAGTSLAQVASFGSSLIGKVQSSAQVGPCAAGMCIYMGSVNNVYLVPLDAHRAAMTACLSSAPPACSGANPRLTAQVEVGVSGNPQTVHVQGWSYYST